MDAMTKNLSNQATTQATALVSVQSGTPSLASIPSTTSVVSATSAASQGSQSSSGSQK